MLDNANAQERESKPLVLIVDDERDIADMLKGYFELSGYLACVAYDGEAAIKAISRKPDVILLDVNMPGRDGFSVCRAIRDSVSCPIIFLTARVEDADMIDGFASGGDDYVAKPFSLQVLGARVAAQLAREKRRSTSSVVRMNDDISIDFRRMQVMVHGAPVSLPRKEYEICALLAKHPSQVFDRDMIYEQVWNASGDSSVVTEHVRRLRKALAQAGADASCIRTVWGVGYSWGA